VTFVFQSLETALDKIREANDTLNNALNTAHAYVPKTEVSVVNKSIRYMVNFTVMLHLYQLFYQ
jgi:hypothetical protein